MAIATEDEYGRIINKRQQIEIKRKFKSNDKKPIMNKQKEKILKEFRRKYINQTRKWQAVDGKYYLELKVEFKNLEQFLSKAFDSIREETLQKVEKECRKIAHRSKLRVGKEGFAYHYEICSYLACLKTKNENSN